MQQLPTLYPAVNDALELTSADDLPSGFVFHPNLSRDSEVPVSFGAHLTTRLSDSSPFLGNAQASKVTTSNAPTETCATELMDSEVSNGSTLCTGISFSRIGSGGGMTQSNSAENASNTMESSGTHVPAFCTIQLGATGSSKKAKRAGKKTRSSGSNVVAVMSSQSNGHTSVNDDGAGSNPYVGQTDASSKSTPKRTNEPCETDQPNSLMFPPVQSLRDNLSFPIIPISSGGQLLYMTDTDRGMLIKPEAAVHGETMDDESTHSESISADTGGGAVHGQGGCGTTNASGHTPPSSVDDMDQHHLKLERKRARNRVAARRCRERKISLIRSLEIQVAERDAHVRCLENLLAQYRSESEKLRKHMEVLANSYPSLRAELYHYPVLFQQQQQQQSQTQQNQLHPRNDTPEHQSAGIAQPSAPDISECVTSKHFP